MYTVVAGTTQTILGDINAVGTCINGITIKSNNTSQATITKSNGAVTAEYIDLSNIIGTGGATYTANNSVDGGGNTGWTINTLAPTNFDLHWIGGNGNWGDGSNWSTTSGGAAYGCIPSSTDNVIFDANSFDATGQTVTVNVPQIYLNSMTWAGAVNNPTFSNGYTMNISGSLTLINEMTYNGGTTKFNSTEIGNTITSVGNNIGNITFDGVGGEWGLQDATIFNNLTLNNGGFSTNNFDLSFTAYGMVSSSNSNVRSLDLGTSTVTLASVMNVAWNTTNTTNLTFDGADSTLILTGYIADCCGNYFNGGGLTFGNISFTGTGVGSTPGWYLQGDNTFNNVSFAANGYLEGNQTINDLTLAAGYVYTIVGGTNQTINGAFNATGISTDLITIKSNNTTQATLTGAGTYCMDYLNMEYMTTSGGGTFNAGINSTDVVGNSGFIYTDTCVPEEIAIDTTVPVITLLGNDPETVEVGATYADAGATALDNVDGNITPSIVVVNPVDTAIVGAYTVTYNVSDAAGNAAVEVTRTVNVVDTTVPVITLLGNDSETVEVGATYADAGATALDNVDGNITPSIVVVNPVNTAIADAYTVTYNVSDAAGNTAVQVTRTVNVVDTTVPAITLLGNDPVSIEVGATYADAGATALDNVDGNITPSIVVVNPVDTAIVGAYTITYNVSDAAGNAAVEVTRTVNVLDITIPVITRLGDDPVSIEVGETYVDAGATASDNVDGVITTSIVVVNPVNTAIADEYTITYNVSDAAGNAAVQVTRTVNVVETLGLDSTDLNKVSVYPNPTASKWTIESSRIINTLTLFNLLGQKVLEQTANEMKVSIDASNLKTGVYMLKINTTTIKRVLKR